MEEPEKAMVKNKGSKYHLVFGLTAFLIFLLISCSCFLFVQGRKYNDEQNTGEVYILKDEVVETGYIHSDEDGNNE